MSVPSPTPPLPSTTPTPLQILASMGLYYPERLAKAIVINAPSWFAYAWKIAAPILDEATRCVCGGGGGG
jgi:hypothetical protein